MRLNKHMRFYSISNYSKDYSKLSDDAQSKINAIIEGDVKERKIEAVKERIELLHSRIVDLESQLEQLETGISS
tara:strand:- start:9529 stop:9750 length:222 start_codon:yes stop_codon:yes gene_type:complete